MVVTLKLNTEEFRLLMDPRWIRGKTKGGFQRLAEHLQMRARPDHSIILDHNLLADIHHHGTKHGSGGWQGALKKIFERNLGPNLDKYNPPPGPEQGQWEL